MKYFQLLVLGVLLLSCKKHGNGYVEGFVYEEGFNIPVSNATIYLEESFDGNEGRFIKNTTTDANGYYKLNFESRLQYIYYLHILNPNGTGITVTLDNKKTTLTNYLPTTSIVKFNVKNNLQEDLSFFLNKNYLVLVKADSTGLAFLQVKGYGTTSYSWYYKRYASGDTSAHKNDSISIYTKVDTVSRTLEIN